MHMLQPHNCNDSLLFKQFFLLTCCVHACFICACVHMCVYVRMHVHNYVWHCVYTWIQISYIQYSKDLCYYYATIIALHTYLWMCMISSWRLVCPASLTSGHQVCDLLHHRPGVHWCKVSSNHRMSEASDVMYIYTYIYIPEITERGNPSLRPLACYCIILGRSYKGGSFIHAATSDSRWVRTSHDRKLSMHPVQSRESPTQCARSGYSLSLQFHFLLRCRSVHWLKHRLFWATRTRPTVATS